MGIYMQFTKNDLQQVQNLATALKKGKFLLEAEEALALAECIKWLANLAKQIQLSIQEQEQNHDLSCDSSQPAKITNNLTKSATTSATKNPKKHPKKRSEHTLNETGEK